MHVSFIVIPVADTERHNKFLDAIQSPFTHRDCVASELKMASEKKVAENMLWGGRFTGMLRRNVNC